MEWTKLEIILLRRCYGYVRRSELARLLNRSQGSLERKAKELDLFEGLRWTEQELETLRDCWKTLTATEIRKLLPGRSKEAIKSQAKALGLSAGMRASNCWGTTKIWTSQDERALRRMYLARMSRKRIAFELERSEGAVADKIRKLGLRKCRLTINQTMKSA